MAEDAAKNSILQDSRARFCADTRFTIRGPTWKAFLFFFQLTYADTQHNPDAIARELEWPPS